MPRPSKPKKPISSLDWSYLNTAFKEYYELKNTKPDYVDHEYTGENGITLEEYESDLKGINAKIFKKLQLQRKEAKDSLEQVLVDFKQKDVIPDLLAFWGRIRPLFDSESKVDIVATLTHIINESKMGRIHFLDGTLVDVPTLKGMVEFMKAEPRSLVGLSKPVAYSVEGHIYSVCRPLLMSAWKLYQNVDYSCYNLGSASMRHIIGPEMEDLLDYIGTECPWTNSELVQFRFQAIESSTHKKATSVVDVNNSTDSDEFNALPRLVKLALLQLWVFAPELYKPYAIMNLQNPDKRPIPLTSNEIL